MAPSIIALFFAAFCIGTTEFVIAGLLPEISSDLAISVPVAGYLISVYAIGVAIGGPFITLGLARFPKKISILALMTIFIVGHIWCALAASFESLLMARVFVALSHGSFFGIATVLAVSVAPKGQSGRAVGLLMAGITVANILGVPGGTAVGTMFGWRVTFWAVGAAALLATFILVVTIPKQKSETGPASSLWDQFGAVGNQAVLLSLTTFGLMLVGFFAFFTFIAPFLLEVTQLSAQDVPILLLIFGVGATVGTITGGRLADWRPARTLMIIFPIQMLAFVAIFAFAANAYAMGALVFLLGIVFFVPNATLINRVISGASKAPELASTLVSTFANSGIAIGAIISAQVLSAGWDYINLPLIGSVFVALAFACATLTLSLDKRAPADLAIET